MSDLPPLSWSTEQRKVSDLIPYEKNPRKLTDAQCAQLTQSLERFGLVEIPAIDTDNVIIAGHQRLKVMSLLGRGEEIIDVRVPNRKLTPSEFDEYLIRSNKNTGEWDFDMLGNEFDVGLLKDWGFSDVELGLDVPPNFAPSTPDTRLDEAQKWVYKCPECGTEKVFTKSDLKPYEGA